ncbi:MAG: winged helix-turn-helix domain-containing protein [Promethearchaeota archaeon]
MSELTSEGLRTAFLWRQGLREEPPWQSVYDATRQIAAVQIDTIAVVARSHHLTLRHRVNKYRAEQLWSALRSRQLFEYYAHGACLIPIEDYPYYRLSMDRFPTESSGWQLRLLKKYERVMETVYQRIKDEGPLASRDFQQPQHKGNGWWDWKPAKIALDLLWQTGRLAVVERVNFQRHYDITERVIPSKYLKQTIDTDQVWRFFLQRVLEALVVATLDDVVGYFWFHTFCLDRKRTRKQTIVEKIQALIQEDKVIEMKSENKGGKYFLLPQSLSQIEKAAKNHVSKDKAFFLTPFDNVLWDRKRVQRFFGVDVKIEAYVPPPKRKFGYYAMPILWNNKIVGRLDPKADRKTKTLILQNLEITIPKKEREQALDAIQTEIHQFMQFHACDKLKIKQAKPALLKRRLTKPD